MCLNCFVTYVGESYRQSLLLPFWRLKKGVAVRAKPYDAVTAAMDMYTLYTIKIPIA
jgi:hypothetical protein